MQLSKYSIYFQIFPSTSKYFSFFQKYQNIEKCPDVCLLGLWGRILLRDHTIVPTWHPALAVSGYLRRNSGNNIYDIIEHICSDIYRLSRKIPTRNLKKKKLFRIILGGFSVMFSNIWEMLFKLCLFCLFILTQESKQKVPPPFPQQVLFWL